MTTNICKTAREIRQSYMHDYRLNTCLAYYLELHQNGHHSDVLSFLLGGDTIIGKQGYTYENLLTRVCQKECKEFTDERGAYAGTFVTYFYSGKEVYSYTNWSLFN